VDKDEALKLGLQVVEAAEYLANNPAIFGEYVQEKRALKRALIQRSKISFEEALAQSESESDDLTAAYLSGVYDGKNKYAPQRQPEQEPHCYMDEYGYVEGEMKRYMEEQGGWFPVYTAPPQREWVGLTEEEVSKLIDIEIGFNSCCGWEEEYTRAVEAKLREKNT
jgi:hypothetical protein